MQNDRQITITTASNHKSINWQPQTLLWGELVDKLRTPVRSVETVDDFAHLSKPQQDELKDVGGFMAGTLNGTRRKANAVIGRDVVTLDLDNIAPDGTGAIVQAVAALGAAFAIYSTRKHTPYKPRLRVLFPLTHTVSADEYGPIARRLAQYIGLDAADPTTFEACRLMYWPSISKDSQYIFEYRDALFIDPGLVLATYADWHDARQWPTPQGAEVKERRLIDKQADPTTKPGTVGAFCRVYDIPAAIAKYIPNQYAPTDTDDRYTFAEGSTTGGAVLYDGGKFLFSHHATDPCSGQLVNAFDMVRLHLFGDKDDAAKADTPTNRMPSYVAMCERATADPEVLSLIAQERIEKRAQEFGGVPLPAVPQGTQAPAAVSPDAPQAINVDWAASLDICPQTGEPKKTVDNAVIILRNDPVLAGRVVFDEFSSRVLAMGALPWNPSTKRRDWMDFDDAGLRHYLERLYGITGKDRIFDAVAIVANENKINDVVDYLHGLQWDGVPRVDTLLIEYFGAADDAQGYTRAVTRKSLVAAVARALDPGCKYDNMLILAGAQGIGKSTFFGKLGGAWFSDSLKSFEGKEACELIQGTWINEIGELEALNKTEVSLVKQFLSQREDIFRAAYGRRTEKYPRRCVFFGTSNGKDFLRDKTGNRRFLPVDLMKQQPTKSVFNDMPQDVVNQIWAEAVARYRIGEPLFLTGEVEQAAREQQEQHRENDVKDGYIWDFIEKRVPLDWASYSIDQRIVYWAGGNAAAGELVPRDRVCAAEIWVELFHGDLGRMTHTNAVEINAAIDQLDGWEPLKSSTRFGAYGKQRGRVRTKIG